MKNRLRDQFIKKNVNYFLNEDKSLLREACSNFEKKLLCLTLAKAKGDIKKAASLLQISNNELQDKIYKFGLEN